ALSIFAAAVGALVVVARWLARHQRRVLAALSAIAAVTVVATVVAIGSSPPSVVGVSAHQMRCAWVAASLAWRRCCPPSSSSWGWHRPPARHGVARTAGCALRCGGGRRAVARRRREPAHPSRALGEPGPRARGAPRTAGADDGGGRAGRARDEPVRLHRRPLQRPLQLPRGGLAGGAGRPRGRRG